MKKIFFVFILASISIFLIAIVYPDNSTLSGSSFSQGYNVNRSGNKVIDAAKRDLLKFMNFIPEGSEKSYGFSSRADFSKAEIGIPFRMYALNTGFLKVNNSRLKDFVFPLNEWRVPILIDNMMVSFLTVVNENENYSCVDLGGSALAGELNSYEKYFDKNTDTRILLRLHQIQCDILLINDNNYEIVDGNCYPLTSAQRMLNGFSDSAVPCKLDELAPYIISDFKINQNFKIK